MPKTFRFKPHHAPMMIVLFAALLIPVTGSSLSDKALSNGEVDIRFVDLKGYDTPEARIEAVVNAPPEKVWKVIGDCANYKKTMPRIESSKLIKRIEVDLDDTRVLHHIVLYRDTNLRHEGSFRCAGTPSDSDFLYAWAPGQDAIQFESGGLLTQPGERFIIQIHYNNAAGITDIVDRSGIRIHYGEQDGTEYGMFVPGPNIGILVSPNSEHTVTGVCRISEEITLLAGMPHMHEAGTDFRSDVIRADGTHINLIELTGWSFEAQLFYEMPITLYPGDELLTTCSYKNPDSDRTIFFGDGTEDEMCFNFVYATPARGQRFCNDEHRFP